MSCKCSLRKKLIKKELYLGKEDIYLDYCSTTKPDVNILAEVEKVNRLMWGNPSSQNSRGVYLYKTIENYSKIFLNLINTTEHKIFFDTSSSSIAKKIFNDSNKTIITSNTEHNSLSVNSHKQIAVDKNGRIPIKILESILTEDSIFIYSPVNHETGQIQDCYEIFNACKKKKALVILDCVQTITRLKKSNWLEFCDGFYFSGHKIHSIPGAAALLIKNNINLFKENETLTFSLYDGTINTPGIIGLLLSAINLIKNQNSELQYITALHNDAIRILENIKTEVIHNTDNAAPGIINISLPKINNLEDLLLHLNNHKIYLSRFSACTGDINIPSKILQNFSKDLEISKTSIRISFGKNSKRNDFYNLVNSINEYMRL